MAIETPNQNESGRDDAERPSTAPCYGAWLPIATAPTSTGARAILFAPPSFEGERGAVGEAFLGRDGAWYWTGLEVGYHDPIYESNSQPTNWMPLPDEP